MEQLEGKGEFRERVLLLIFLSYKMGEKTNQGKIATTGEFE